MEISLFGYKTRIELIVIFLLLGSFIGANLFCSCVSIPKLKETFENLGSADLGYKMGGDIDNSIVKSVNQVVDGNIICERKRKLYDNTF
jgi:hypothetical protein